MNVGISRGSSLCFKASGKYKLNITFSNVLKKKKQPIQKREKIFTVPSFRRSQFCRSESNVRGLMEIPRKLYATSYQITGIILQHEKFLQFDWLRAVIFQLNLKYLLVKITNLLRVVVWTNNSMSCTIYLA